MMNGLVILPAPECSQGLESEQQMIQPLDTQVNELARLRQRVVELEIARPVASKLVGFMDAVLPSSGSGSQDAWRFLGPLLFLEALSLPKLAFVSRGMADLLSDDQLWCQVTQARPNAKAAFIAKHAGKALSDLRASMCHLESEVFSQKALLQRRERRIAELRSQVSAAHQDSVHWTLPRALTAHIGGLWSDPFTVRGIVGYLGIVSVGGAVALQLALPHRVMIRVRVYIDGQMIRRRMHKFSRKQSTEGWRICEWAVVPSGFGPITIHLVFDRVVEGWWPRCSYLATG